MALSYIIPEKIGVQSNCLGGFVYDYSGIGIKTSFSMAAVDFVSSSDLRDLKALVPISCDYSGQLQSKTDRNVSAERELHYDYFLDENAGQILDASKRTIAKDVTFAEAEIIATWTKGEDKEKTHLGIKINRYSGASTFSFESDDIIFRQEKGECRIQTARKF